MKIFAKFLSDIVPFKSEYVIRSVELLSIEQTLIAIFPLQTIQHKMAEMKTSIAVCRTFIDECIELHDAKQLNNSTASMTKYWATDLENKVAADCLQV